MNLSRTDLTVETAEELSAGGRLFAPDSGVQLRESLRCGCPVTCIRVASPAGARAIGRPVGRYVTIDLRPCLARQEELTGRAAQCLAGELRALLPPLAARDTALVVGMGNEAMTPDAVGAEALTHLLVTRHMVDAMPRRFGHLRSVAALRTGVLAQTGVETLELIRGAVSHIRPTVVIAVDALAARSRHRLCATVQLSDAGLTPGSGVGNHRKAVDAAALNQLADYACEFLVHAVDVEGRQSGIDAELLGILAEHSPIPCVYAGGIRNFDDIEQVRRAGNGRIGYTIGSALDIFGGPLSYAEVVRRS